jgi:N-acetylglutamate synthase-like GNAT family acetyltransferase
MHEVTIEPYQEQYKNEVADLILTIQQSEFGIPITLDMQPDLAEIRAFYQTNNGNFWVAKIEGIIIGTIALLDIGQHKSALRKMFVHQKYRGKEFGVGQQLLDTLVGWSKQKNIHEIFLGTTEKFVRAQRFYEKNGFEKIEKQSLPETFPLMEVDTRFYRFLV